MLLSPQPVSPKPILKWAGGKTRVLPQLARFFPTRFSRYIEPFVGGGAVFFWLDFNGLSMLNDANLEIVQTYEVLREHPQQLISALKKLGQQYSEAFYYQVRSQVPESKIESAARTIFLNKTGFNGLYRQNAKGAFNVPYGKRLVCPRLFDEPNVMQVSKLLQRAVLTSSDFETIVNQAGEGDFVYCDPPYEPLSQTSSFTAYTGAGFSQDDQTRLMQCCLRAAERGAWVVISNSSADFIKDLYKQSEIHFIQASRAINSKASKRGKVEEIVVVMKGKFELTGIF